jgi:hypothetical protein
MGNFSETKRVDVSVVELATELARCAVLKDAGYEEDEVFYGEGNHPIVKDEVREDFDSYYEYYHSIITNF